MPERGLWDNVVLPPTLDTGSNGAWYEIGVRFTVTATTTAVGAKWYRPTTTGPNMTKLNLYRVSDQALLRSIDPPTDNGAIGWQRTDFPVPVELQTGVDYVVTVAQPNLYQLGYKSGAGFPPTPGSGLAFDSPYHMSTSQGTHGFPGASNNTGFGYLIDIVINPDIQPPTGDVALDVENALARWFSADDDNTRRTHLPWITKAVVDAIAATQITHTGSIAAVAPTVMGTGGPTLATLAGQVATAVGLTAVEAAVNSFVAGLLGNQGQDTIHEALNAISQQTSTNRSPQDVIPVGGTGWTLMDTITGTGPKAWTHDADAYTLDIDVVGSNTRMQTVLDGVTIFYMRGFAWWWDGTHVGHRIEVNGILNVIRQPQARYPGLLLDVPTDVEWTLRAWDYTA